MLSTRVKGGNGKQQATASNGNGVQDHRPKLPRSMEASAERGLVPAVGLEMTGLGGLSV
jgi:hypothetical protein